jgi:hypothetical protein
MLAFASWKTTKRKASAEKRPLSSSRYGNN